MDDNKVKIIVSNVITKKFNFVFSEQDKIKIFDINKNYISEKQELDNIMTDLITNEFLKTEGTISQFFELVYVTFNYALKTYIEYKILPPDSIIFIYKGGNVLRIIAKEFMHELPGGAADILSRNYDEYFKKSDLDFSIFIDPTLENFEEIFDDITKLSYLLLNYLREIFLNDRIKYFDFYKNNIVIQKKILFEYLNKLNKSSVLTDPTNKEFYGHKFIAIVLENKLVFINDKLFIQDYFSYRDDFFIDYYNKERTKIVKYKLPSISRSEFYISVNRTLRFKQKDVLTAFNLVRMKINFKGGHKDETNKYYSTNLVGELIDIGISHKDATDIKYLFQNKNNYVRIFTYIDEKNKEISFRATSYIYLIHELESILFIEVEYPWNNIKYEKRVRRLFFLYLLDILTKSYTSIEKIIYFIIKLKTDAISPFINIHNNSLEQIIQEVIIKLDQFIKDNKDIEKYYIHKLIVEYNNLLKKLIGNKEGEELIRFVKILNENIDTMIKALYEIQTYINSRGFVNTDELYKFSRF